MGGDRTCPDNCVIATWHGMPEDQRTKERRRPLVEILAKQGYTQEAIAMQLGVSHQTVGRDLETLSIVDNVKGQGKDTLGRKKSTGRPKGRQRKTTADQDAQIAGAILDSGKTYEQAQQEFDVSNTVVRRAVAQEQGRREAQADPPIDPATLSLSAQEKLAAAMRQYQRKLDAKYEKDLRDGIQKAVEDAVLPHYEEKIALSEQITKARQGLMKKSDYNKIRFCLHPDQYMNRTPEQRNAASQLWEELEVVLVSEAEKPTDTFKMPKTYAELLARKQAAQEKRKTRRGPGHQSLAATECG
jgi:transposase